MSKDAADWRLEVVRDFFRLFHRDWQDFRALWTRQPVVEIPFAPPGFSKSYKSDEEFNGFWHPVFHEMRGKFDWTIVRAIPSVNSDEIVIISKSDVDVVTARGQIEYQGDYIQIFSFEDRLIAKFTEYVDSYRMAKVYGV